MSNATTPETGINCLLYAGWRGSGLNRLRQPAVVNLASTRRSRQNKDSSVTFFNMLLDSPTLDSSPSLHPATQSAAAQTQPIDYDVAIVGGGIVGLTLACALKESGLRIALIEAKVESAAVSRGQAYHVNLLSSRIFAGIGVWSQMRPGVNPIEQIRLSDQDYPGTVQFKLQDLQTPALGYVSEHRVLLEGLRSFLTQCDRVTSLCPVEVVTTQFEPDGVALTLRQDGQEWNVRSRLLVAADGARSPIRQKAGISTIGWQYWQSCVVAFIKPEKAHRNIAYERFQADGPFAILPLPENLCRIVWTAPKQEAAAILALKEDEFLAKLKTRYGDQMGELELVGDRYLFPVQLMHSRQYVQPRLALIGDAAHCCHPVGGQGVNLGIRDAAALAEVLQTAHQQGKDIGELTVLRRYERWRKLENWKILAFTDLLDRLFSNNILPIVMLRRLGLWMLQHLYPVKQIALRLMVGLSDRAPNLAK
ncbi:MAG: FAD-dependent hydroxylase [Leptolyngbyaceae cyanobacterium bins.349]|nr:FAD-dependent hydroxylase [Leptolyngbyaceae cyanobacterium bins.349]